MPDWLRRPTSNYRGTRWNAIAYGYQQKGVQFFDLRRSPLRQLADTICADDVQLVRVDRRRPLRTIYATSHYSLYLAILDQETLEARLIDRGIGPSNRPAIERALADFDFLGDLVAADATLAVPHTVALFEEAWELGCLEQLLGDEVAQQIYLVGDGGDHS
ncbi:hypothetical protein [Blastococcus sp. VKM Ac-2987]|uniref:hypothetical protein n=1 Tax=Blastococcus sp. VKM Ac-2987 TaxID=3004141 RepID=UPI0022AB5958|nr:hypothetical protein [Blastococcus sp. VKM Ac-2987]MCZ2857417.1 hypothetical protein [Blastococcus sp. VKM Ac-2987]